MGFTLSYLDKNSVRKSLIRATSFIIKSACTDGQYCTGTVPVYVSSNSIRVLYSYLYLRYLYCTRSLDRIRSFFFIFFLDTAVQLISA